MDREDERVAARVVVEDRLDRRVRQDPAVPVEVAVDANGRKGGRQRARGHHVADGKRHVAAVEIAHFAGAHFRRADGEARRCTCAIKREVDEFVERLL